MAGHLLRIPTKLRPAQISLFQQQVATITGRSAIGNRDVVGYGHNGSYIYADTIALPFPAIRFKENGPIQAIKEKELGDWRKLSIDEKKALYRTSFCSTFSEILAPTGVWKQMIGAICAFVGSALWVSVWLKKYVMPPLPESFKLENRQAELRNMIDLRAEPITGLAAHWDYENNRWKKSK